MSQEQQASIYAQYVGIDVAAETAEVAVHRLGSSERHGFGIAQTEPGWQELTQRLVSGGQLAEQTLVVMEATGNYWMRLAASLYRAGFVVSVINPLQAHHFAQALLQRAKLAGYFLHLNRNGVFASPFEMPSRFIHGRRKWLRQPRVSSHSVENPAVPPRGCHIMARSNISVAAETLLYYLYHGIPRPEPQNYKVRRLADRNREIRSRFAQGEDSTDLAKEYGISRKRIYQLIHGQRK